MTFRVNYNSNDPMSYTNFIRDEIEFEFTWNFGLIKWGGFKIEICLKCFNKSYWSFWSACINLKSVKKKNINECASYDTIDNLLNSPKNWCDICCRTCLLELKNVRVLSGWVGYYTEKIKPPLQLTD